MLTESSEIKASQAFRETPLQPRRSSSDMQDRRRRYFRHVSVSLLQPGRETGAQTHEYKQTKTEMKCVFWFLSVRSGSYLQGWVLRACFGWTSPLRSAGWWSGRWGCCSGRGLVSLNGACGGSPDAEWSRWCPGLLVANTASTAAGCDCHSLEQRRRRWEKVYCKEKGKKLKRPKSYSLLTWGGY